MVSRNLAFVVGCAVAQSSGALGWEPPTQYSVSVLLELPYIDLVEPILVYYDEDLKLERLDYWHGADTYVFNLTAGENSTSHQIVPTSSDGVKSEATCFSMTGAAPLSSVFPDVSKFSRVEGTKEVRGVEVDVLELIQPEFDPASGLIGNYSFYVRHDDGATPVSFEFVGHNTVTGGHVDEWNFVYSEFLPGPQKAALFEAPWAKMTCSELETDDDDGPTAARSHALGHQPLEDLAMLHATGAPRRVAAFRAYADRYGKTHGDDAHERFALFHGARRYVNAMNRRHLSYALETNHLADWTPSEKARLRGRKHTPAGSSNRATKAHGAPADVGAVGDVDWRDEGAVTKVKDQGSCGSCWSYGTTGAIEGQHFLKHGKLVELSQQNLMDCSWKEGNNACDGGLDSNAYDWMLDVNGGKVAEANSYGSYKNADGYCHSATAGAAIAGYVNVTDGLAGFNDALANVGPLSISIDATPNSFYYYKSGFYYADECKSGLDDLDHTVLAVGTVVHGGQKYTIVKNSWSTHWGDEGYVYISQKNNCCGVATDATYPLIV